MNIIKYLIVIHLVLFSSMLWANNSICLDTIHQIQKDFKTINSKSSPKLLWMDLSWLQKNLGSPEITNTNEYKWVCTPETSITATLDPNNQTIKILRGTMELTSLESWSFNINFKNSTFLSFITKTSSAPSQTTTDPSTGFPITKLPPMTITIEKDIKLNR